MLSSHLGIEGCLWRALNQEINIPLQNLLKWIKNILCNNPKSKVLLKFMIGLSRCWSLYGPIRGTINIFHKIQRIMCTNSLANYKISPYICGSTHFLKLVFLHLFESLWSHTSWQGGTICPNLGTFGARFSLPKSFPSEE